MVSFNDEIWNELIAVAKGDGTVTSDEEKLLDNIKRALTEYYEKVESQSDDKATLLEQIIDRAYAYAQKDNMISWDELAILKKLKEVSKKL
ncbi:MAG: hypothetical protein IH840_06335 [Candidatus Heimdallarchaeota archaeon]|nr:hypothetical protein [Candidatus Heimdallarchaeota archaeon]